MNPSWRISKILFLIGIFILVFLIFNQSKTDLVLKIEASSNREILLSRLNGYEYEISALQKKIKEIEAYGNLQNFQYISFDQIRSKSNINSIINDDNNNLEKKNVELVIVIKSGGPKGFARRSNQRKTWLAALNSLNQSTISYFFALANHTDATQSKQIMEEMQREKDMVLFPDVENDHSKLTLKLLAVMKYVQLRYDYFHLVIVDDDTFVNPFKLIESYPKWPTQNLYSGYYKKNAPVILDTNHPNFEPFYKDSTQFPPVKFFKI